MAVENEKPVEDHSFPSSNYLKYSCESSYLRALIHRTELPFVCRWYRVESILERWGKLWSYRFLYRFCLFPRPCSLVKARENSANSAKSRELQRGRGPANRNRANQEGEVIGAIKARSQCIILVNNQARGFLAFVRAQLTVETTANDSLVLCWIMRLFISCALSLV